ncbi:hypothetical protein CKF54_01445 [Psittacicella hinzii]|uniref:Mur ligase central domain-containing protein n=1 Tax=Psittacicella hinzii TaxID=2028575 RepID=A0A3A1YDB1_9GAMM|nr:UDP-N-acetylmuramoyl-tripeptide--D-alanyl-D-alanine ligase [Psittacicella hinzii]RIY34127.1 hypothetical protein CKF54_01445 [Psittacicella hinzii]
MPNAISLKDIVEGLARADLLDNRFIPYQETSLRTFKAIKDIQDKINANLKDFLLEEERIKQKQSHELALNQEIANLIVIKEPKIDGLDSDKEKELKVAKASPKKLGLTLLETKTNPLDLATGDYAGDEQYHPAPQVLCDLFAYARLPFASQDIFLTTDTRRLSEISTEQIAGFFVLDSTRLTKEELASIALKRKNCVVFIGNLTTELADFCFNQSIGRVIPVTDIYQALEFVAGYLRIHHNPLTVAITGSSGKTSIKEAIAHIFSKYYENRVISTAGNFNNELGVPITLLDLANAKVKYAISPEVAVVEHGANHLGEIYHTSLISRPDIAVINNIQPAHTEGFGGLRGVSLAKAEVFANLNSQGVKVINLDSYTNDLLFARHKEQTLLTFSAENNLADFYIDKKSISAFEGQTSFDLHINGFECKRVHFPKGNAYLTKEIFVDPQVVKIHTNLKGTIGVYNATAALITCLAGGIPLDHILYALKDVPIPSRRDKTIVTEKITYIDDSYNANPGSVLASLENLTNEKADIKIYALGNLAELDYQTKVDFFTEIYDKYIFGQNNNFYLISNLTFSLEKPKALADEKLYVLPFNKSNRFVYVLERPNIVASKEDSSYYKLATQVFEILQQHNNRTFAITFKGSNSSKMNLCMLELLSLIKENFSNYEQYINQELITYVKTNYQRTL